MMSDPSLKLFLGLAGLAAGVLTWSASAQKRRPPAEVLSVTPLSSADAATLTARMRVMDAADSSSPDSESWLWRVIRRVSRHQGGYDSVNRNTDGAGLSFGILQWVQKTGTLSTLLEAMVQADPARFATTFGPDWQALRAAAKAATLNPVAGAVLWQEPWVSRFVAAGRDPVFQAVQNHLVARGEYMVAALAAAQELGFTTERSVAVAYDTSIQQGQEFTRKLARQVRDEFTGRAVEMRQVLRRWAELAPAHFHRTQAPTGPYPAAHIAWKQVGPSEWHAHAGRFDLYTDILRRRMGLVEDPELRDEPIPPTKGNA